MTMPGHQLPFTLNGANGTVWLGLKQNLAGWVEAAAAAGFDYLSPDCPSLAAWMEEGHSLAALARKMRDAGVASPIVTICAMLDGSPQQDAGLAFAVQAAEALGARILQVNMAADTPAARLAALEQACRITEGTGLKLALEYMPTTGLSTLAQTVEIVDAVGHDRAGALVDIWHHSHDPQGWETLATCPLSAIAYAEFCDAPPPVSDDLTDEMMHRRLMPGEGVLDCARFADVLHNRGFNGIVSVEVLNREWRDRPLEDFAQACFASTSRYF